MPPIAPLLIFFLLFTACSETPPPSTLKFQGIAMTIPFEVQTEEEVSVDEVSRIIRETFAYVDQHYNKFNPESELSAINALPAHQPTAITEGLYTLLSETNRVWKLTHGYFDPTVEPAAKIWKEAIKTGMIPSSEDLEAVRGSIGWGKVHFDKYNLVKDNDALEIDLGGIAKGYTVDLLYERLKQLNIQHLYVEWGGEIRVSKDHPAKRPWRVALKDKETYLELSNQACATSGDYEQNWKLIDTDGHEGLYFHILNPLTLNMLEAEEHSGKSFTVIAPTCTLADGIATSLFFYQGKELEMYQNELLETITSLQIFSKK